MFHEQNTQNFNAKTFFLYGYLTKLKVILLLMHRYNYSQSHKLLWIEKVNLKKF